MTYYPISINHVKEKVARKTKKHLTKPQLFELEPVSNIKIIQNNYGETLTRVDGEIPVDLDINEGDRFLFISYDQSKYSHGIHKYPAKFFPELPRWLIQRYSEKNDLILDPFTGSATSNVEALLNNRNSIGIDVDPFSRFLAKVKTTPLNLHELKFYNDELLKKIVSFKTTAITQEDIPAFPYRDNWFQKDILFELSYIKSLINTLDCSKDLKDFYLICLSSIIRSVSNADNNCTRTVVRKKLNKQIYPSLALTKFAEALLTNQFSMTRFSQACPPDIDVDFPENGDARNIPFPENHFDFALTSPPYVNAVDYPRTHQLEIYWLGFANDSLLPLKKIHVGTETVKAKDYTDLHLTGIKEADEKLQEIFKIDKRRAYIAYKYLFDMELNLQEVYRTLKSNSRYAIVVGNNTIRNAVFENWKYILKLASRVGFELETYFGSEIIKHFIKVPREERINTDWVLILKKH